MNKYLRKINNFRLPFSFSRLKIIFITLIIIIFAFGILESIHDGDIVWKIARDESGEFAWKLLIFTIFISLLSKLFPKIIILKQLFPLRKHAGLLVFFIVLCHAIFHFLRTGVLGDISGMYFESVTQDWAILIGTISFLIMIPLTITSTSYAIKKIGYKSWKLLHKATHIVFILAALHISFIKFSLYNEIESGPIVILTLYLLGYGWIFWHNKKQSV